MRQKRCMLNIRQNIMHFIKQNLGISLKCLQQKNRQIFQRLADQSQLTSYSLVIQRQSESSAKRWNICLLFQQTEIGLSIVSILLRPSFTFPYCPWQNIYHCTIPVPLTYLSGLDMADRLDQGGGMGLEPDNKVQLTTTCQHLNISAVQPILQLVQVHLDVPTRQELKYIFSYLSYYRQLSANFKMIFSRIENRFLNFFSKLRIYYFERGGEYFFLGSLNGIVVPLLPTIKLKTCHVMCFFSK